MRIVRPREFIGVTLDSCTQIGTVCSPLANEYGTRLKLQRALHSIDGRPRMKRRNGLDEASPAKKSKTPLANSRPTVPDYCDTKPRHDETGRILWPADDVSITRARAFITEW